MNLMIGFYHYIKPMKSFRFWRTYSMAII